jgi:hypothetical protein
MNLSKNKTKVQLNFVQDNIFDLLNYVLKTFISW